MDPDANWEEAIGLAARLASDDEWIRGQDEDNALRLAELVLALHAWVKRGGFPPRVFRR
jgi:hypothetical protein